MMKNPLLLLICILLVCAFNQARAQETSEPVPPQATQPPAQSQATPPPAQPQPTAPQSAPQQSTPSPAQSQPTAPQSVPAEKVPGELNQYELTIPGPARQPLAPENPDPVPRQFRGMSLGQSLDDLKTALVKDELFVFRGDRDVSWLPVREQTLVETTGLSYIRRAYFQIQDGAVYIMSFSLDTRLMDHYSVFTSFVKKYGEPVTLDPGESVWESEDTRVSIERPLTIKYIDKKVFDRLVAESKTQQKQELFRREEFLADF